MANERKTSRRIRSLFLSAVYCVLMVSLAAFSYVTYAWFTTNRTAQVNFASLSVSKGINASLKVFRYNQTFTGTGDSKVFTGNYYGYEYLQVGALVPTVSYSDDFLAPSDAASLTNTVYYPGYASSYLVEISNLDSLSKNVGVYLAQYTSVAGTCLKSTGDHPAIALAEAMRVYVGTSTETLGSAAWNSAAQTFLTTLHDSDSGSVFQKSEGTSSSGNVLASPEAWGSGLNLPANGTLSFFITVYFANFPSTFYALDSADAYYTASLSGNSNVYSGLSIAFNRLIISA